MFRWLSGIRTIFLGVAMWLNSNQWDTSIRVRDLGNSQAVSLKKKYACPLAISPLRWLEYRWLLDSSSRLVPWGRSHMLRMMEQQDTRNLDLWLSLNFQVNSKLYTFMLGEITFSFIYASFWCCCYCCHHWQLNLILNNTGIFYKSGPEEEQEPK